MYVCIRFDENSDAGRYFLSCARVRNIRANSLMLRLFTAVTEDQMISCVLDDSETIKDRKRGERCYKGPANLNVPL